jgi:hypothetical protein
VTHAYNPSYSGGRDQEDQSSKSAWAKIPNTHTKKRAGRTAQMVEHLPSKSEALSSSPSTTKKKKMQSVRVFSCFYVRILAPIQIGGLYLYVFIGCVLVFLVLYCQVLLKLISRSSTY